MRASHQGVYLGTLNGSGRMYQPFSDRARLVPVTGVYIPNRLWPEFPLHGL
jgi:hypothetical protein